MSEPCPSGCWTNCQCPPPQDLIADDTGIVAVYPKMSMMRVYRDLIVLKQVPGVHMMQALVRASPAARISFMDFPRWTVYQSGETARNIRAGVVDLQGKSWIYSWKIGTTLAHHPDGSRVFVKPQLRRIQRAVRAFIQHRRWLKQARRVFTRCMINSRLTPDLVQHICRNYVK